MFSSCCEDILANTGEALRRNHMSLRRFAKYIGSEGIACKNVSDRRWLRKIMEIAKSLKFPSGFDSQKGADLAYASVVLLGEANEYAKKNEWDASQSLFAEGISKLSVAINIYIPLVEDLRANPPDAPIEWAIPTRAMSHFNQAPPQFPA